MLRKLARKALKRAAGKVLGRGDLTPSGVAPASPPPAVVPRSTPTPSSRGGLDDGIRFASLDEIHEAVFGPGKVRLVNHWATWCEGCLEELPLLVELRAALDSEVTFLGIDGVFSLAVLVLLAGLLQSASKDFWLAPALRHFWIH